MTLPVTAWKSLFMMSASVAPSSLIAIVAGRDRNGIPRPGPLHRLLDRDRITGDAGACRYARGGSGIAPNVEDIRSCSRGEQQCRTATHHPPAKVRWMARFLQPCEDNSHDVLGRAAAAACGAR
jgi:hypothetical protein